jgi:hypothetical protein
MLQIQNYIYLITAGCQGTWPAHELIIVDRMRRCHGRAGLYLGLSAVALDLENGGLPILLALHSAGLTI